MGLKPDRERTATGYVWLDKLTHPYWAWQSRRADRIYWSLLARKGESWRDARARYRNIFPPLDPKGK